MKLIRTLLCVALFSPPVFAYEPTVEEKSSHLLEVFDHSREYIAKTFNLEMLDESVFNAVRLNSKGLWGDYNARVSELGRDWFEVKGWCITKGQPKHKIRWSVVVHYELEDPNAWQYKRIDIEETNEPTFTSWKFGKYYSIPYIAQAGAIPEAEKREKDWDEIMPWLSEKKEG